MVLILASTKTISRQVDIPVSGIALEKSQTNYTRYIDKWEELEIKASVRPANAKNQGLTYTCSYDEEVSSDLRSLREGFAKNNVTFDNETGIVKVQDIDDGIDYSGKYTITISTNDGNYQTKVNLNLRYYYARTLEFTDVYRNNEDVNFADKDEIKIDLSSTLNVSVEVLPGNIQHSNVKLESSNKNVIDVKLNNISANIYEATITPKGYGEAYIVATYTTLEEEQKIVSKYKVIVVENYHDKIVENIKLVEDEVGMLLSTPLLLNQEIDIQDIRYLVNYVGGHYPSVTTNLVSAAASGSVIDGYLDTTTAGKHTFAITYDGFTQEFEYEVLEKKISDVKLNVVIDGELHEAISKYDEEKKQHIIDIDFKVGETLLYSDFSFIINYTNSVYSSTKLKLRESLILSDSHLIADFAFDTSEDYIQEDTTIEFSIKGYEDVVVRLNILSKEVLTNNLINFSQYFALNDVLDFKTVFLELIYTHDIFNEIVSLSPSMVTNFDTTSVGEKEMSIKYAGQTYKFKYFVEEIDIDEIVLSSSYKQDYLLNEAINLENIKLFIVDEDEKYEVSVTEDMIVAGAFDTSKVGTYNVQIKYHGLIQNLTYTVWENQEQLNNTNKKIVSSIEYLGSKVVLKDTALNDLLKYSKLSLTYTNQAFSEEEYLMSEIDVIVSGFDTENVGKTTVTITYQGVSQEVELEVVDTQADYMYLDSTFKTSFLVNEVVDVMNSYVWVETSLTNSLKLSSKQIITNNNTLLQKVLVSDLFNSLNFDTTVAGSFTLQVEVLGQTFDIHYNVYENEIAAPDLTNASFDLVFFKDKYLIGDKLSLDEAVAKISNQDGNNIVLDGISEYVLESETLVTESKNATFEIKYHSIIEIINYQVMEKVIEYVELLDFDGTFELEEEVLIDSVRAVIYYGNNYAKEVRMLTVKDIEAITPGVVDKNKFNTSSKKTYTFTVFGYEGEFSYTVIDRQVKEIIVESGLESEYVVGSDIDFYEITLRIVFQNPNLKPLIVSLGEVQHELPRNLYTVGEKVIKVTYSGYTQEIKFNLAELRVVKVALAKKFDNVYLLNQKINLNNYSVELTYNNGEKEIVDLTSDMIVGNIDTTSTGTCEFKVQYEDIQSIKYSFSVLSGIREIEDQIVWSSDFTFQLNVATSTLNSLGHYDYGLELGYDDSVVDLGFTKLPNGSFEISGRFLTNELGQETVITYQLAIAGVKFDVKYEATITQNISNFELAYPEYIKLGASNSIYVTNNIPVEELEFIWSTSDEAILSIAGTSSSIQINGIAEGTAKVKIIVKLISSGSVLFEEEMTINVVETYDGLSFNEIPREISNYVAIGREIYDDQNGVSKLERSFEMVDGNGVMVPSDKLLYFLVHPETLELVTSIENVATLENGKLIISDALTESQIVVIKAISKGNYELGLTMEGNYASLRLMLVPGVNVSTYKGMLYASENSLPAVLLNNINIGQDLFVYNGLSRTINPELAPSGNYKNDDEKMLAAMQEAARILRSEINYLPTTADWSYYENNKKSHPDVKYCYEITNDIFGNGYIIDTKNITTVTDPFTYGPLKDSNGNVISVFEGPLNLVWFGGNSSVGASAKAQDNIAFLIRNDNIRLDNVTLQACDDDFLLEEDRDGTRYIEMNHLNYVGTTLEIMGDNVDITNSRIKNGRTVVRVYGKPHSENPLEVEPIHVRIESSVLSMGREFILKMGTNQFLEGELNQSNIWESVSPYLTDNKGNKFYASNYDPLKDKPNHNTDTSARYAYKDLNYSTNEEYNMNNEYFMNNLVKTFVTVKNSVFTNSGFFSIGLESTFAGPCLDGMKYGSYDFKKDGWENIAGTSYPAMLTLQGDVRIYDWKPLSSVDSSTLIDGDIFAFDVQGLFKYLVDKVSGYELLVTKYSGGGDDIYVHGGIALYGGGKNYHIVNNEMDTDLFPDHPYYVSMKQFASDDFISSGYVQGNFAALYKALPYASGNESFKFYIYDNRETTITYQKQLDDLKSQKAYEMIKPVNE